jgi:ketosteroid isomerase-like protein
MTTEANKQVIRAYFEAVNARDNAAILSLLTPTKMKKPLAFNLRGMIAEGDRVAVQADSYGEMLNGKIYDNAYHFIFAFADGLIREVLEYCCTYTAFTVFGEFIDPPPAAS